MNELFPIFLKLEGRQAVVIGGGRVALRKVEQLAESNALIRVVARSFAPDFAGFRGQPGVELIEAAYEREQLAGAFIVFACTDDSSVNRDVYQYCREQNILVNAADSPPDCNFYMPSIVKQGDLKIAISTNNRGCAYTRKLRMDLEELYDERYSRLLIYIGRIRDYLKANEPDIEVRGAILKRIAFAPELMERVEEIPPGQLESFEVVKELKRWS